MAREFFPSTKDCSAKDKTIRGIPTFQAKFAPVKLNQKYTKGLDFIPRKHWHKASSTMKLWKLQVGLFKKHFHRTILEHIPIL